MDTKDMLKTPNTHKNEENHVLIKMKHCEEQMGLYFTDFKMIYQVVSAVENSSGVLKYSNNEHLNFTMIKCVDVLPEFKAYTEKNNITPPHDIGSYYEWYFDYEFFLIGDDENYKKFKRIFGL